MNDHNPAQGQSGTHDLGPIMGPHKGDPLSRSVEGDVCKLVELSKGDVLSLLDTPEQMLNALTQAEARIAELERRVQELTEENQRASEVSRHAADASAIRESELSQLRATLAQERDEAADVIHSIAIVLANHFGSDTLSKEPQGFPNTLELICKDFRFIRAQIEADRWKPIETAPKDGTPVLLWRGGENINRATIGWYKRLAQCWSDGTNEPAYPTHWQPLPQPPQP